MANWLQKILPQNTAPIPPSKAIVPRAATLPANAAQSGQLPANPLPHNQPIPQSLPPASIIYGMAASGLFVIALYFLVTGRWFTGLLILLPVTCFMGFALYYLKGR